MVRAFFGSKMTILEELTDLEDILDWLCKHHMGQDFGYDLVWARQITYALDKDGFWMGCTESTP